MNQPLGNLLETLTFQSDPIETLYLNEPRVQERFIQHLGAIKEFVRTSTKSGTGGVSTVFKVEGTVESQAQVTWNLEAPIAKALLLRATLQKSGEARALSGASVGDYVTVSGSGYLVGGFEEGWLPIDKGLYESIESRRSRQEQRMQRTRPDTQLLTLALLRREPLPPAVSFVDIRWVAAVSEHWEIPTEVFGVFRDTEGGTFPVISAIHAFVRWGGDG